MDFTAIEDIALRTLLLLEWRLKRLEFLLTGNDTALHSVSTDHASLPVTKRLHRLEQSLQKLSSQSSTVSALLNLQNRSPQLFTPPEEQSTTSSNDTISTSSQSTTTPPLAAKVATLLAHAPTLQTTASQLRALQDQTTRNAPPLAPPPSSSTTPSSSLSLSSSISTQQLLPPTSSFTTLVSLTPRIDALAVRQRRQAADIAELRKRAAAAVVAWQEVVVVGQGRCWVEWEGRVRGVERAVGRRVRRERVERGEEEEEME